jgi:hypothetical protein
MANTIARLPHTHGIRGRSSGSIYNGMAWVAAVSDKRDAPVLGQAADFFAELERLLAGVRSDKTRILSATIQLANLADKAVIDEAPGSVRLQPTAAL